VQPYIGFLGPLAVPRRIEIRCAQIRCWFYPILPGVPELTCQLKQRYAASRARNMQPPGGLGPIGADEDAWILAMCIGVPEQGGDCGNGEMAGRKGCRALLLDGSECSHAIQ
jgi:hypothetical protein